MLIPYEELSDVEKAYDLDMALDTLKVSANESSLLKLLIHSHCPVFSSFYLPTRVAFALLSFYAQIIYSRVF